MCACCKHTKSFVRACVLAAAPDRGRGELQARWSTYAILASISSGFRGRGPPALRGPPAPAPPAPAGPCCGHTGGGGARGTGAHTVTGGRPRPHAGARTEVDTNWGTPLCEPRPRVAAAPTHAPPAGSRSVHCPHTSCSHPPTLPPGSPLICSKMASFSARTRFCSSLQNNTYTQQGSRRSEGRRKPVASHTTGREQPPDTDPRTAAR